ncbi:MAG: polysaccharide biosynthesis C-terminal domain-containing protein [Candidatus Delongbacteria bacterium]|nr:polysaccharide biosynthesis C-terminal domain-containing protein [Candidatus Delongbacteria bacterium]
MSQSYFRSFIKDNALVLSGHILIYLKGIILLPILIKSVGITVYGGYTLVIATLGFLFGISSFGAGFRCKRFLPSSVEKSARQLLFYPQFLFQVAVIVGLSLLALSFNPLIERHLHDFRLAIWLVPLYLLAMMIWSQSTDYFRYTNRMAYFNYSTVVHPYAFIGAVLLILSLKLKLTVNLLLASEVMVMFFISIPLSIKMLGEIGLRPCFYKIRQLAEDLKLGFPLVLTYLVDFILSGSDRYLIAAFISVTAVGYYNPAYTLGSLIMFFPRVSGVVLPPLLSRAVDNGREGEAQTMLNYTLKGFLLIAIPFVAGSYVLSEPLLTLFANAEVASKAVLVTPIVALGILFYGLTTILNNVFFVQMKTKVMFKVSAAAAILNVLLNLIFLYFFRNVAVAAVTTMVSYLVVFLYTYRVASPMWKIDWNYKNILRSILASIIMILVLMFIKMKLADIAAYQIILLLSQIIIGIFIYSVVILALGVFSKKELIYLKKVFMPLH